MRMYDIIEKKRDGNQLTDEEIAFFVKGYATGEIPDYQASALCMAIYFQGMTARETATLTMEMVHSGDVVDLSKIDGIKVDKHSTGGVGDKTSLVVAPIVASLGVRMAKMSGRGLGHTGGTLDKLESIPGLSVAIESERFAHIVNEVGVAIISQTGNLVPADKRLYGLRDVTATVDSLPLIASSIMSKKIAAGADKILLDVKCGSGAFMKTVDDAIALAKEMVSIGEEVGRTTVALITDMGRPLGMCIGNTLEVAEAATTLQGKGPKDLTDICVELAGNLLHLAGKGDMDTCRDLARAQIANGEGFAKLKEMVAAQGGNAALLDTPFEMLVQPRPSRELRAAHAGSIFAMDTERCGIASVALGAGREKKEDTIDYSAGIVLAKKTGDSVQAGDLLATLYAANEDLLDAGEKIFTDALDIREQEAVAAPLFHARVSREGVERFDS
ncbi:MAG: pyrimidine-nucleoside phosphorylase [Atopobium sp.]|uniref:pyrimidine-nucleoside phosphorylase n=1 Tax=Atopobium sp. TaxID=1872650 RepID=UPI002A754A63|nr:pyrimidine-nucleoside phosphorylase [Atopobium sp.]MDY2788253.1 pyrimidine-nucleoside phosphorylase [Atopobium sp.]MDY4522791.1 pyrimidine-nucleoside phosphorylase [Atopobium sp.]